VGALEISEDDIDADDSVASSLVVDLRQVVFLMALCDRRNCVVEEEESVLRSDGEVEKKAKAVTTAE
jgi:hypothetical protein